MPATWYSKRCIGLEGSDDDYNIVADKKPYFMKYVYNSEMRNFREYIKNTNRKCLREFRVTVPELLEKPNNELTNAEKTFLFYYRLKMPLDTSDCVLNRICRRFEAEFDGYFAKDGTKTDFDYKVLGGNSEYSAYLYGKVYDLYCRYNDGISRLAIKFNSEKESADDRIAKKHRLISAFSRECDIICPNRQVLRDILLDMCYKNESTKAFVWDISGRQIVECLLEKSGGIITYPVLDSDGDFKYCGNTFSVHTKNIGGVGYGNYYE